MENNVILTDNDLSIIQTALTMTILSATTYKKINGEGSLDAVTESAMQEMQKLSDRLMEDHFKQTAEPKDN
jgi:hypothetical protein